MSLKGAFNSRADQGTGPDDRVHQLASTPDMAIFSLKDLADGGTIQRGIWKTTYDPQVDDALNQVIGHIVDEVALEAQMEGTVLNELLEQDWDLRLAREYEATLFREIQNRLDEIPALSSENYRHSYFVRDNGEPFGSPDVTRHDSLHALSTDIENGTLEVEWDCERQTAVMGVIATMVEQRILESAPEGQEPGLKNPQDYTYISARAYLSSLGSADITVMNHAFAGSMRTGGMIEATSGLYVVSGGRGYLNSLHIDHTFEDFRNGEPFVSTDGDVYAGWGVSEDEVREMLEEACNKALDQSLEVSGMAADYAQRAAAHPEIAENLEIVTAVLSGVAYDDIKGAERYLVPVSAYEDAGFAEANDRIMEIFSEDPSLHTEIGGMEFHPLSLTDHVVMNTYSLLRIAGNHGIELGPAKLSEIENNIDLVMQSDLPLMIDEAWPAEQQDGVVSVRVFDDGLGGLPESIERYHASIAEVQSSPGTPDVPQRAGPLEESAP